MIKCKFITNGLSIQYDGIVRPCCTWIDDSEWKDQNHYTNIKDFSNWHKSPQVLEKKKMLDRGEWPDNCVNCKKIEELGRGDSMRGNGNSAYKSYNEEDITLEIRPGSVCNFACQSCWPDASSRVRDFMHKAGIIEKSKVISRSIQDFEFLHPVSHRIKDVVLLGGEPFFDKHCQKFLNWATTNLKSNIMIFTNGQNIDYDFIKNYKHKLTLIFSIDAIGKPAEYIRYGGEWEKIKENFLKTRKYENTEVRVNITTSAYNLYYLKDLLDFLMDDWPNLVTFGTALENHLQPNVIPIKQRQIIIDRLEKILDSVPSSSIQNIDQKYNLINAINSLVYKLKNDKFDDKNHEYLCSFIKQMDKVKKIEMQHYCPELFDILFQK